MKTIAAILCVFFFAAEGRAVTITVTNNLDAGPGSLRQAVIDVNASVDPANKIQFVIPGGPAKITLTSAALPSIIKQVTVDGTTQPGWSTNSAAIALSCPTLVVTGLTLGGPPSIIRGLRIQDFTNSSFNSTGIGLNSPGHTVADCQIISNYFGVQIHSASNTIGGFPASTNRNVISGNGFVGINITTGGGHNIISGNLIGTDPTGTSPMGNGLGGVSAGIVILSSPANVIGGTSGVQTRNVISGNNGFGIFVTGQSGGADNNVIIGNYIGVNAAGSGVISNNSSGVSIASSASNRVGGTAAGDGNVIAGNIGSGIGVSGTNNSGTIIQGNLIGTFVGGITAPPVANSQVNGILVQRAKDTLIGGSSAAARNVISGNKSQGIRIEFGAQQTTVRGNFIGVELNGVAALSNGAHGIAMLQNTNTAIVGNVLSGNANDGININGSNIVGLVIQGNFIGSDLTGKIPLPNFLFGIRIDGSDGVLVGGTNSGDGNTVAFNFSRGIVVLTNTPGSGVRNSFLGNLIYSNANLGIDLDINGATPNDAAPDADGGANNRQNFPVVTNAQQGSTFVQGFLVSATVQTYRCEFFATNVPQGMIFLGATNIATPDSGTATFSVVLGGTAPTSAAIFATATATNGDTSEFGPGVVVQAAADTDGDGLWDAWEIRHFGSTVPQNGGGDPDVDGFNNYFEFVSDSQPTNGASFFELVSITNGLPHFPGWVSSAARWYDVEYSTNLLSPTWASHAASLVGSGGTQTVADVADDAQRSYRVRVKVP